MTFDDTPQQFLGKKTQTNEKRLVVRLCCILVLESNTLPLPLADQKWPESSAMGARLAANPTSQEAKPRFIDFTQLRGSRTGMQLLIELPEKEKASTKKPNTRSTLTPRD